MRKIVATILLGMFTFFGNAQTCTTTVAYDYMETYTWAGDWWIPSSTSNFYTNASVSPSVSAAIYGLGSGTSAIEQDWYSLPNITGLNPFSTYKLSFRMASYRFTSTSTTRGVDNPDFVEVQVSYNGGVTYTTEMRIRGNSNAYWNYNTAGVASKTANNTVTTYQPTAGGDRTATGDGYSVIELTIPPGATQLAFDIYCRINSAGEEWWFDNFMLEEIFDCSPLPIELLEFKSKCSNGQTTLIWSTASEFNTDYYKVEKSSDGFQWKELKTLPAAGWSNQVLSYQVVDERPSENGNYYRLTQYDYDGANETFDLIYANCYISQTEEIKVYPNPAYNIFNISVNEDDVNGNLVEYRVYNSLGLLVDEGLADISETRTFEILCSDWDSGLYTIWVGTRTPVTQKITIMK
jgi:hypothetical protein